MSARWPFFTMPDGEECCDHSEALAQLLHAEILFPNSRPYDENAFDKQAHAVKLAGPTIVLFVIANDVFAWGCADAECLDMDDVGPLYKAWHADKRHGVDKWLCKRRNERPQKPVEDELRKAGVWDDEMEALPPNQSDAKCYAEICRAASASNAKPDAAPDDPCDPLFGCPPHHKHGKPDGGTE